MTDTFEIKNLSCYTILVKCWNGHHYDSVSLKRGETKTFIRGLTYLLSCGGLFDPFFDYESKYTKYKLLCIRIRHVNDMPIPFISWSESEYL